MSSSAVSSGLFAMNTVDFDFNLPFEQLFLSIIPSALFILSSSRRIARQFRKPNVINARSFQIIKLVGQDLGREPSCVQVLICCLGRHHDLCWPRVGTACSAGRKLSFNHGHISAVGDPPTDIGIVHGCSELARSREKLQAVCSAERLSLLDVPF